MGVIQILLRIEEGETTVVVSVTSLSIPIVVSHLMASSSSPVIPPPSLSLPLFATLLV